MAHKVQRNAPCPCGSGKKYKKCCQIKDNAVAASRANKRRGTQIALGWVNNEYKQQITSWVDNVWLHGFDEEQRGQIGDAHPGIRSIHDVNLLEYLVAEGTLDGLEGENSPLKLILAADIGLDDEQRDYLSQLATQPLQLYKVSEVETNTSFTVEPYPDGGNAITIEDSSASTMFDAGDVAGLRLMQSGDSWETSGALYHIPDAFIDPVQEELSKAEPGEYSKTLVRCWLDLVAKHV